MHIIGRTFGGRKRRNFAIGIASAAAIGGRLASSASGAISTTGAYTWSGTAGSSTWTIGNGTSIGVGTVDGNAPLPNSITGLNVFSNSATASTLSIASGQTLTTTGAVVIGPNVTGVPTTTFDVIGSTGTWNVTTTTANFDIGGGVGGSNVTSAALDMSGLGTFSASLGSSSSFVLGDTQGSTSTASTYSLNLATNSTITAGTLKIGDTVGGSTSTAYFGAGTNTIDVNTINVGAVSSTSRSSASLGFAGANGSIVLRGFDGTSAVTTLSVAYGSQTTGGALTGNVNFSGHSADLKITTLNLGGRNASVTSGGSSTGTFSFDTGSLSIASVNLGTHSNSANGDITATLNIGNSSTTSTTVIGSGTAGGGGIIASSSQSARTNAINSTINISGGTVNIGSFGNGVTLGQYTSSNALNGTSIQLGGFTASTTLGSTNAALNITGGTTTLAGNITQGGNAGGTGTVNASITLNGGTLDLTGHDIGGASATIGTLNFQSGGLRNVGEINNGAVGLTKTAAGMLILSGTSSYTGATTIEDGALVLGSAAPSGSAGALGNATTAVNLGDATTITSNLNPELLTNGAYIVARNITAGASGSAGGTYTIGGDNTSGVAQYTGSITLNQALTLVAATGGTADFNTGLWSTGNKAITVGTAGNTGIVEIDNTLADTGGITVADGTLALDAALTNAGSNVTVSAGTTFSGNGSVAGATGVTSGFINGSNLTLTGITTFNGAGNTLSGAETATVTVAAGAAVAQSGTLTGTASLTNGSTTLTGNGAVTGAVTLNGGGNTLTGNTTFVVGGVTVNGTNNTIGSGGAVTGNATQNSSSGLIVSGVLNGSDSLASSATLSGVGTVGAVSLAGSNTLSSSGTLTIGAITVLGASNVVSSGSTIAAASTTLGTTDFVTAGNLAVNGKLLGAVDVYKGELSGTGTLTGLLTTHGGSIISPGGDGTIGTLAANGGLTVGASDSLDFDLGNTTTSGGSSNDLITTTNLSFTNASTDTVAFNFIGAGAPLLNQNYTLITYSGTLTGTPTSLMASGAPSGDHAVFSTASGALDVKFVANNAASAVYSLTAPTGYTTEFSGVSNPAGTHPSSIVTVSSSTPGSVTPGFLNRITNGSGAPGPKAYVQINGFTGGETTEIIALALTVNDGTVHEVTSTELTDIINTLNASDPTGIQAETFASLASNTKAILAANEASTWNSNTAATNEPFDLAFTLTTPNVGGSPQYFGVDFSALNVDGITSINVTDIGVVPEPTSLGFLAAGVISLLGQRKRRPGRAGGEAHGQLQAGR